MQNIDYIRQSIWERIRAHQANGISVRNEAIANLHGGESGFYFGETLCLLGALSQSKRSFWDFENTKLVVAREFNISLDDVVNLEAGFEGWKNENTLYNLDSSFYKLGAEIGAKLAQEEVECIGSKPCKTRPLLKKQES